MYYYRNDLLQLK